MAFQRLASTDTAVTAGVALGGYMAPFVTSNILGSRLGVDLPGEVHGLLVFALVAAMRGSIPMPNAAEAGALVYTTESAAERFGVKSTVANLGGN